MIDLPFSGEASLDFGTSFTGDLSVGILGRDISASWYSSTVNTLAFSAGCGGVVTIICGFIISILFFGFCNRFSYFCMYSAVISYALLETVEE